MYGCVYPDRALAGHALPASLRSRLSVRYLPLLCFATPSDCRKRAGPSCPSSTMSYPQLTPARPVPGAFINTPAVSRFQPTGSDDPVRRRLFGNDSNTAGSGAGAAGPLGTRPNSASAPTQATPGPSGALAVPPQAPQPPQDVPPVTKAAQAINRFLQADQSFPELDSYARCMAAVLCLSPFLAFLSQPRQRH